MDKSYNPQAIETKWQEKWKNWEVFRFNPQAEGEVFSVDTPPRYASGFLHMGHAKNYTEFEIIARAMRLLGRNVYFPVGYDDNGLPTEKYVEEELGVDRRDVGKEKFIEKCKEAAEDLEADMTEMYTRLGMSWDWSTFYRTIDDWSIETAQRSFLDLYRKGELYREEEPVLWCPYHETSLAQATVEEKERHTKLNYLYFETDDGEKVEIATTRPELLPSTVAVFVHPDDESNEYLVGKKMKVPLFDIEVPVLESEEVDPDFGSGVVMVCTFGDNTDVELWREHDLPLKISIDEEGRMNERAGKYEGLKVKEAQERIIEDLKEKGILFKQEDLQQTVGVCWRCETPIEFIPAKQWFVNVLDHKDKLLEQGEKVNWNPGYYQNRYEDWVKNLKWDWCISRQRYYGVPFPVWYCEDCGSIVVAEEEDLPVDPRKETADYTCGECGSENLRPEKDVMDTWMTSSMTPQITTKWTKDEEFFEEMFPMSLRPQAHDIIRTWAFYTILKAHLHHGSIPWKDVMISGYVYAEEGVAMSASKGTGVSPQDIIEEEGADCLRYWVASATTGEDLIYEEKEVTRGKKILTKLWNASRFVEMHLDDYENEEAELEDIDKWLLTELSEVLEECKEHYRSYDASKVRRKMEDFFLSVFCDNYLEMVKHRLYNLEEYGEESKQAALRTLYQGLLAVLKVFMPIIPHITEEIYQSLFREKEGVKSINLAKWPRIEEDLLDEEAREVGELAKDVIEEIRRWKSDEGIPLNREVALVQFFADSEHRDKIDGMLGVIKGTMNIKEVSYQRPVDSGKGIKVQNQPVYIKKIETA
ncbi:MAG: valine--tRNA ligase [Candidatus Aenigmatarchaeota archaeon]